MKYLFIRALFYWLVVIVAASCGSYRQNIMFKVPKDYALQTQIDAAEKNYVIQKNDYLKLEVYTNDGERIIDPNMEALKDMPTQSGTARPSIDYLVNSKGLIKLPMLGELKLDSLTIRQAEEILQKEYSKYYKLPFVSLKYVNKRVIILGSPGGQLIPLINENVRLTEVLAMARGLDATAKAHNIRILRGDQVFIADFSTIEGYHKYNMIMNPGDIVYIEPIRRPLVEGLRDYGPFISVITSLTTLVFILLK